ncbi:ribosomal protection-like ABC-F family protein [Paenibacillus sacheonensis]|uniref:ABC-F type ribosomal protection protein n=1 Tax=Paenibacillus sacheonensis TaxID=742054 RepID=A0A7X5C199_9BACL|nr:ABC-F type ribosomal protection protein [Paenibacillus sacheonensis]MBM7565170.1 ATP-binding cassette subfamily F protein 3 [Paenibacillus sacheonensis]NBC70050.1 ABC-F type ribosomal protection protein [Paenibacillus sacheonensis]
MLLQVSDVSKSYGVSSVLSSVTFQVLPRERVGLVGVNGAGKSTLLRIIAGEISADSGTVYKSKETTIGYLAQSSGLQSDKTIDAEMRAVFAHLTDAERELRSLEQQIADPALHGDEKQYAAVLERYARLSDWFRAKGGFEMENRIRSVVHGMGFGHFPPDTVISTLSGGQKTRLALARILLQAPDLLMLDEPTNYLDIETLTWLEDYLRGYEGGILVVSHDRYFLDAVVGTIVEIERHNAKRYTGNYSRFIEIKAAEFEAQMKQYDKQQDEIAKLEDFVQRNIVRASTTKRAQSRRKALEKMDRLDKPMGDLKKAHFSFEIERQSGNDVLDVRELSITFAEKSTPLFRDVTFRLERGENVALVGPNGIGKSTLLKSLVGQQPYEQGTIRWGTNVKIGYYDQEHTGLNKANTVLEELWSAYPHLEEARIRTVLGNFLFSGEDVKKRVSTLSGGERARVSLSKLMLAQANMLILDEPTNHLDLYSKEVLEAALMDYDGTLLFISHDRYFLNKMAERIVELHPEGTEHFLGNYDEMIQKKREIEELLLETLSAAQGKQSKSAPVAEAAPVTAYEADKQAKRDERNRQRKQEQLENDIARLEGEISSLEQRLTDPEVYNDYVLVGTIQSDIDTRKAELQAVYDAWEELLA